MKTRLCLFLVFLFASISLQAQNDQRVAGEFQVTSTPAYETTPTLGNDGISDLVVFTVRPYDPVNNTTGSGDIWYQRLENGSPYGEPVQVTSAATNDELNDVWGDYIVYTAYDNLNTAQGTIMLYKISTATLQPIASAEIMQECHIFNDVLVWREGGVISAQIMMYRLDWLGTTMPPVKIAGPVPPTFQVQIGERFVVWTEIEDIGGNPYDFDVHVRDLGDGMTFPLTNTPLIDETSPSVSGPWVVWSAKTHGSEMSTIVAMNVDNSETRVIADNGANNLDPSINGDLIVWESDLNGNLDLFAYQLSTGKTFQVTSDPSHQYEPDLYGNIIVYADTRNGSADIYASVLRFTINIPDPNFEQALIDLDIDSDKDINHQILISDAEGVTSLDLHNRDILDLTGIEAFVDLTSLDCRFNQLEELNLTQNTALTTLMCAGNQLTSLDVTQNTALTYLLCANNQIDELDVSQCTGLKNLFCFDNNLSELVVLANHELLRLDCGMNQLTSIDISKNPALIEFACYSNQLTALNLNSNTKLTKLICENNQLTDLNISNNLLLSELNCGKNQLTSINVQSHRYLEDLECYYNQLAELDVSRNGQLTKLLCFVNDLEYLNVQNGSNEDLTTFSAFSNELTCIDVDDELADHSSWNVDPDVIFSNDCGNNTQRGDDVQVALIASPSEFVRTTFKKVLSSGETTVDVTIEDVDLPEGYEPLEPSKVFDINTTAVIDGDVDLELGYAGLAFENEEDICILHKPMQSQQFQIISNILKAHNDIVKGTIQNAKFSPFVIVEDIQSPVIIDIQAPSEPIPVGSLSSVVVTYEDNNLTTAEIYWGDEGVEPEPGTIISNTISWDHTYATTGVYEVNVRLVDAVGHTAEDSYQYIVVYDPSSGFVTGGGWIDSPVGASTLYPDATGKANFGFESKYDKKTKMPIGNTEFQFKAGDLNFNSNAYDWLVIAGSKAMFKGEGTINGAGNYKFLISATDGDMKGDGEDRFRIKIWEELAEDVENVIYDNQIGESDDADPSTSIGGGSIVIHTKDMTKSATLIDPATSFNIYPNPFDNSIYIDMTTKKSCHIIIDMVDMSGRVIAYMYTGIIKENVDHHIELNTSNDLIPGFYMLRIRNVNGEYLGREMILKQ